jgi:hypothetical protein
MIVDFMHPELGPKIHSVKCLINRRTVLSDKQTWSLLLVAITERFIEENNSSLNILDREQLDGRNVFFLPQKEDFGTCSELSNGKWIYINYNYQTIVRIVGNLCCHCGVALDAMVIKYLPQYEFVRRASEIISISHSEKVISERRSCI